MSELPWSRSEEASEETLWGASLFSYPQFSSESLLEALARDGIRAWVAPARAGASGYLALLIHPEDASLFKPGPTLSAGRCSRERWCLGERLRLVRFTRSDFPARFQAMGDNTQSALAIVSAREESALLESCVSSGGASKEGAGKKRL